MSVQLKRPQPSGSGSVEESASRGERLGVEHVGVIIVFSSKGTGRIASMGVTATEETIRFPGETFWDVVA